MWLCIFDCNSSGNCSRCSRDLDCRDCGIFVGCGDFNLRFFGWFTCGVFDCCFLIIGFELDLFVIFFFFCNILIFFLFVFLFVTFLFLFLLFLYIFLLLLLLLLFLNGLKLLYTLLLFVELLLDFFLDTLQPSLLLLYTLLLFIELLFIDYYYLLDYYY